MNPKVNVFLAEEKKWKKEIKELRRIVNDAGLTEELTRGQPCFSLEGRSIVLMHGFKEHCALLFMKGSLRKDAKGIPIQQPENVQAARQIRFTSAQKIKKMEKNIPRILDGLGLDD